MPHRKESPSAAIVGTDKVLVTWTAYDQDGSGLGVYGQLIDLTGQKIDAEFKVNTDTVGDQRSSPDSLATLTNGSVVSTWYSSDPNAQGAFAQRFSLDQPPVIDTGHWHGK